MTGMLGNHPRRHWQGGCGGGCCNTAADDRHAKKAVKQVEKLELRQIVFDEVVSPDDSWDEHEPHVYDGERCTFCNVNVYDEMIYGPTECISRDALTYTTETP